MSRFRRLILNIVLIISPVWAQQAPKEQPKQQPPAKEEVPPEEDETLEVRKEYSFNPLQAEKEFKIGSFYFKKGSYRAAERRFQEALKWNPTFAEACLKLGDTAEKLNDTKVAREAYVKYLDLAPEGKQAPAVKKKLAALPPETRPAQADKR